MKRGSRPIARASRGLFNKGSREVSAPADDPFLLLAEDDAHRDGRLGAPKALRGWHGAAAAVQTLHGLQGRADARRRSRL